MAVDWLGQMTWNDPGNGSGPNSLAKSSWPPWCHQFPVEKHWPRSINTRKVILYTAEAYKDRAHIYINFMNTVQKCFNLLKQIYLEHHKK